MTTSGSRWGPVVNARCVPERMRAPGPLPSRFFRLVWEGGARYPVRSVHELYSGFAGGSVDLAGTRARDTGSSARPTVESFLLYAKAMETIRSSSPLETSPPQNGTLTMPHPTKRSSRVEQLVLVVDDEVGFRELYCQVLEEAGFATAQASSAEDALRWMEGTVPSMVISDLARDREYINSVS